MTERRYKVFLSSTAADLDPYRTAVHAALDRMERVDPQWMKGWVSHSAPSLDVCEEKVRGSQIFVGLIGHCFGSAPDGRDRSYTMLEWDWAVDADLPRLMHVAPGDFNVPAELLLGMSEGQRDAQRRFREEDLAGWHTGQRDAWDNPDRLAAHVAEAVRRETTELDRKERSQVHIREFSDQTTEIERFIESIIENKFVSKDERAQFLSELSNRDKIISLQNEEISRLRKLIEQLTNALGEFAGGHNG